MSKKSSLKPLLDAKPLAKDFIPGPLDVICARGSAAHNHRGNKRLKEQIKQHLEEYSYATSKQMKTKIVTSIVSKVRHDSSGGGFVKEEGGRWFEVGDHLAREKVGQSFRDLLQFKYKSSTMSKKYRRKVEQSKLNKKVSEFMETNCCKEISEKIRLVSANSSNDAEIQERFNQANSDLLEVLKENERKRFKLSHESLDHQIQIPLDQAMEKVYFSSFSRKRPSSSKELDFHRMEIEDFKR